MPFSITYSSSNNDQLLRSIAGAYFKQQRISKDLSLIETSKALHLNKGFLSDLEHGNRHFPEGIINQLNSFYSCNFDESISLREDAEKMLSSAYTFLFQKQRAEEINILSEAVSSKKESSYAFLTYTILKLFYHIRVSNDINALTECKLLLDHYCHALSDYEKSVYYSLLALFYKRDISKAKVAHECLSLSYSYCSSNSIVFAMNAFQEIAILGKMNQPALALLACQKVKSILREKSNYKRLSDIDLFESNCLILSGEQEEAQKKLKSILELGNNTLSSNTFSTIQSLSFSYILSEKYEECIQTIEPVLDKLPEDTQWFLPFCLYHLNRFSECIVSINTSIKYSTEQNTHFLLAIQYRIADDASNFIHECKQYYSSKLSHSEYDNIPVILHFLLDFAKEKNNPSLQFKIYADLNQYHEKTLTFERRELLQ